MRNQLPALLGLFLLSLPLHAAGDEWSLLTPPGGNVTAVASSPTVAGVTLMGVSDFQNLQMTGVYRSTDGGTSWVKTVLTKPFMYSIFDIEFAPDGTVFVGSDAGLWKSLDDGATWTLVPLGVPYPNVLEIAFVPGSSSEIWIGMQTPGFSLMHSTDAGATWQGVIVPGLPPFMSCRGIVLDPSSPTFLAVAFSSFQDGSRILLSSDSGNTWGDKSGLLATGNVTDIASDGARIWVTSDEPGWTAQSGLSYTTNFGQSWQYIVDPSWPAEALREIEIDPGQPSTIYLGSVGGGVYRSTDGGGTWVTGLTGTAGLAIQSLEFVPGTAGVNMGTAGFGFMRSTDGLQFSFSNGDLALGPVSGVASNPLDPSELAFSYSGLDFGGVATSLDGGLTWAVEALPPIPFSLVRFSPTGVLHAVSQDHEILSNEVLWRRDAGGWIDLGVPPTPAGTNAFHALGFFESDPQRLLVGANAWLFSSKSSIWLTSDGGASWSKVWMGSAGSSPVNSLLVLPDGTDQTVLATFYEPGGSQSGLLRSSDSGATWSVQAVGLPAGFEPRSLTASPLDPSRVYLAGTGGVLVSLDGGLTWSAPLDGTSTARVIVDALRPERLFRMPTTGAPEVSDDGGTTWAALAAAPVNPSSVVSGVPGDLGFVPGDCGQLVFISSAGAWEEAMASCALSASAESISGSAGGSLGFGIDMGPGLAGDMYWLLASGAGTAPGLLLDGVLLPLNVDPILMLTLNQANTPVFSSTLGVLDNMGRAAATVNVPAATLLPPGLLHFASLAFQVTPVVKVTGASNAVPIEWLP